MSCSNICREFWSDSDRVKVYSLHLSVHSHSEDCLLQNVRFMDADGGRRSIVDLWVSAARGKSQQCSPQSVLAVLSQFDADSGKLSALNALIPLVYPMLSEVEIRDIMSMTYSSSQKTALYTVIINEKKRREEPVQPRTEYVFIRDPPPPPVAPQVYVVHAEPVRPPPPVAPQVFVVHAEPVRPPPPPPRPVETRVHLSVGFGSPSTTTTVVHRSNSDSDSDSDSDSYHSRRRGTRTTYTRTIRTTTRTPANPPGLSGLLAAFGL